MTTESPQPTSSLARLRIERPAEGAKRSRKSWRWGTYFWVLLILLGGGGFAATRSGQFPQLASWLKLPDSMQQRPEVRLAVVSVTAGEAADATVVASGYLESRRQAKIGSRAPGRIEVLHVEEGSRVKADEVIAVLEHADLDASLAAAQASLTGSQAQLVEQAVVIERTKLELDRAKRLRESRSISDVSYDSARFEYEAAVARRDSLQASIKLAEARVREAEQMKENTYIRAPFDGTVISKDAEVGESILPGGMGEASGRGSVVTIADLDHLEVDCDVKEDYISRITSDQRAEVAVDAVPDRRYQGRVRKVIPMGDRARATIKVKVAVIDADERLFPEMSCTAYFLPEIKPIASAERRIFCDASAIIQDGDQSYVWGLTSENRLQRISVQTGTTRDQRTEILDGLAGDERVVIVSTEVKENQLVKLAP